MKMIKTLGILAGLASLCASTASADFIYGGYDTSTGYYQESGTASVSGEAYSTTSEDTNAVQVRGGTFIMQDCTVTKEGGTSHTDQSDDSTSFYGLNSAVFAGNSNTTTTAIIAMTNGTVTTSGQGANAFFAYGGGILYLDNIAVTNSTSRQSRGLIATGGGQIYASNMYILTQGETSSVIATDRGGGTVVVDGGDYDANGDKCAIIYSAGTMKAYNATGESSSGEIGIIEGDNSIVISNCTFTSGSTSRALLMMQSGSGDADGTNPVMEIIDSTLVVTESDVPLLEVATCVTASLTLDNVDVTVPSGVLMAVMEDSQWSTSGAVGNLTLKNGDYTGTVTVDDGYTGNVTVDSTATWTLTANTTVDTLVNNGTIATNGYTLAYTTLSGNGTIANETSGGGSTDSGSTDDSGGDSGDSGDSGSGSTDSGDATTSETALADETGILDARPELLAFPNKTSVTAAGTYEASAIGTDFVLSGTIDGNIAITATETCRITLSDLTMSGVLAITGDAQLWLRGANTITTTEASAITSTGTLTIGGPGTLAASAPGGKKIGVIAGVNLVLAGGTTTLTIDTPTAKNASGVSLSGNYTQLAGTLKIVGASGDYKQNGVFLSKKNMKAAIYGGTLDVTLAGEKSVGLAMDKDSITGTMSGGVIKLAMSGDGAKGVKGEGTFTMTGGAIDATITGGYVEELLEYETDDESAVYNYYVTIDSSTTTSGNSEQGSDSLTVKATTMINAGTYAVYDPSKAYAVKVGTLTVSDGLIRVRCTGTCGRGLGADTMNLSGGVYDISVAGGPTDVYMESLIDADDLDDDTATNGTVTVCLDSGGAACLKADDITITGGTFELLATGNAGKLINAGGTLVIGTEGATTLPTDSTFAPDIQGQALGEKVYCTYYKQKYYGSLATAVATTNISEVTCAVAQDNIVSGSGDDVDYSNPKGAKAETAVIVNGGRLRIYTANDGGEGLESKDTMTINGGVIELNCADDCINTAGDLEINGGYIYAASTGNDAIDSNANVTINDGWIYAFTLSNPEEAIDVNSGYYVTINGGYVFGIGAAQSCREGTLAGTQGYYQGSQTLSTSATYWKATGTDTVYGKIPAAASSTTAYLFCSVPGMTSGTAPTSYGTTAPTSANSVGFHGYYTTGSVSGN